MIPMIAFLIVGLIISTKIGGGGDLHNMDMFLVGLVFVAALAWNGAIQAIFKQVFGTSEGIGPMVTYAIIVTVIAILATIWIGNLAEKSKK